MQPAKRLLPWLIIGAWVLAACAPAVTPSTASTPVPPSATFLPAASERPVPTLGSTGTPAFDSGDLPPTATHGPRTLTVLAAASLTGAFTELGALFEATHPGVTVSFNFAGSNALAHQINEGAAADVFASANRAQMEAVIAGARVVSGSEQVFARNRLVVIYPSDNPGEIDSLEDLAKPGLSLVLAAAEVPVGQYALDFLDKAAADGDFAATYKDDVLANVVSYEDNVRAVLTKVALGEADAGLVYSSDVVGDGSDDVRKLDIPDALNTLAAYPIAALVDAVEPALGAAFVDLVLSAEGQAILGQYGFITVP